jgi:MOSC domain-containing protein YiiM
MFRSIEPILIGLDRGPEGSWAIGWRPRAARLAKAGAASQAMVMPGATSAAASVTAVSRSSGHTFSKPNVLSIRLVAGLGIEGDAHMGETVKHLYLVRKDPNAPNLRQVHLMHEELFDALRADGFDLQPGALGENITTRGVDLLGLPEGTRLRLGAQAVIEITGLRNPCRQIEAYRPGLLAQVLEKDADGNVIRKSGVMAVVIEGGDVQPGDPIVVELPAGAHRPLRSVG